LFGLQIAPSSHHPSPGRNRLFLPPFFSWWLPSLPIVKLVGRSFALLPFFFLRRKISRFRLTPAPLGHRLSVRRCSSLNFSSWHQTSLTRTARRRTSWSFLFSRYVLPSALAGRAIFCFSSEMLRTLNYMVVPGRPDTSDGSSPVTRFRPIAKVCSPDYR